MNKFTYLLEEINNKLDLPQPLKSRVLLEISGDIEEIYHAYLERGLSEDEAEQKTKDKFLLSDEAFKELIQIHSTPYRRWLDRLSQRAQTTWEQILLVLIFLLILFSFLQVASSTPFFTNASKFIYPILITLLFAVILFIIKFYQFYLKKDHEIRKLRAGLDWMLYFSIAVLFFGISGYFGEIYLSTGKVQFLGPYFIISLLTDSSTIKLSVDWMMRSSAMLLTCSGSLMIILVFWFSLTNKAGKIEEAEASILLEN